MPPNASRRCMAQDYSKGFELCSYCIDYCSAHYCMPRCNFKPPSCFVVGWISGIKVASMLEQKKIHDLCLGLFCFTADSVEVLPLHSLYSYDCMCTAS